VAASLLYASVSLETELSRRVYFLALLSLSAGLFSAAALAKDFGVQGQVWPIIERDMRELLVASAARVDWAKTQEQAKENAKKYLDRLPKRAMPTVAQYEFRWFDPSIVLLQDIQAPVRQADGSLRWQTLAARGSRVSPLQHVQPTTALFFYDGGNAEQMRLAVNLARRSADYFMFIEAGRGSLRQASEAIGRPVYHANDALLARFEVRALPSLVFPGKGESAGFLGIATFAPPYSDATVRQLWPLPPAASRSPRNDAAPAAAGNRSARP